MSSQIYPDYWKTAMTEAVQLRLGGQEIPPLQTLFNSRAGRRQVGRKANGRHQKKRTARRSPV